MGVDEGPAGVDRPAEESDLKEPMAEDPGGECGDVKAETVAMVTTAGSEELTGTGAQTETAPRSWKWSVIYLCIYGFMSAIKPGEPFITPYLLSTEKNFTREQVTNEINPVLSYSYMVVLVPVLLLTDFLRYKPVLVVQGLSQVAIWLLLLLGSSLPHMQLMEFFYGVTMAARVAYSSYIFSLVTPGLYQRVASYSRTAVLMGVFFSSVLGQLCMSLGDVSYTTLSGVSLGFVLLGLLLSLCLPWPKRSMFFNRTHQHQQQQLRELVEGEGDTEATKSERDLMNPAGVKAPVSPALPPWRWCTLSWRQSVFLQMLGEVRGVVREPNLRLWCLWWVFNSTGYYLVLFYVHILWNKVYPATENKHVYNGGVEAVSVLLGAITSFLAGLVKIRWNLWSELLIGVITALQAGLLLLMGLTDNIWVCYVAYALFRGFYQFLVPIAIFQIASSLTKELCALVFGINTFLGTIVKTIITLIVADKRGLGLDVHAQFLVYFFYFALLTVIYMVCAAVVITRHYRRQSGGGASARAMPSELSPTAAVESQSDAEPHSNGKPAST
ncbi:reduced folate transporter [Gadus chalcogrammus]|uniref:reduced folate transporter n=1 Tax=Gadus chalcogrammus TaxID=1042646 RepID=UPI0024C35765|nr:reduced folate transporter [Gadus chalcogrammus]